MSADFKTVLLVDDEPSLLRLCQQILTLAGYRVLAANGGEEALRIVENEDVHVALLDVTLPKMNGFELARRLQQRDSNIRVLFMSGYGPEEITGLVDLSHFVLVPKPFTMQILIGVIENALARSTSIVD